MRQLQVEGSRGNDGPWPRAKSVDMEHPIKESRELMETRMFEQRARHEAMN